jgi:RNA-directed DNA polymerase
VEFERDLNTQLSVLRELLMSGRYRPQPPVRFTVPKRDGSQREVVVLAVVDRVAQRAAQQVIDPLWEPEFLDCNFGFRPGRSTDHAVAHAQALRKQGLRWVVDGDIAACFDSLDHDLLMTQLKRKIHDGRVLNLLQLWLDAGVMKTMPSSQPEQGLAAWAKGTSAAVQRGMDWALATAAEDAYSDPYEAARYDIPSDLEGSMRMPDGELIPPVVRQSMLKRLTLGGLTLGLAGAKWAVRSFGTVAITTLKSPLGRRLLKKGALATGGLAGLAAAAAVTAFVLHRKAGPSPTGALQGSPLSPLLANVYLHPFDVMITKRGHQLVRFADDWVILCPTQDAAEVAYNDAIRALARLRLKVNPEKMRILAPKDKLEWLGMAIR